MSTVDLIKVYSVEHINMSGKSDSISDNFLLMAVLIWNKLFVLVDARNAVLQLENIGGRTLFSLTALSSIVYRCKTPELIVWGTTCIADEVLHNGVAPTTFSSTFLTGGKRSTDKGFLDLLNYKYSIGQHLCVLLAQYQIDASSSALLNEIMSSRVTYRKYYGTDQSWFGARPRPVQLALSIIVDICHKSTHNETLMKWVGIKTATEVANHFLNECMHMQTKM